MNLEKYFNFPVSASQRHYEALRAIFIDGLSTKEAAKRANFSYGSLKNLRSEAEQLIKEGRDPFFPNLNDLQQKRSIPNTIVQKIIAFRKKNLSIVDIKTKIHALGHHYSLHTINKILKSEGFSTPLPRRTRQERQELIIPDKIIPPQSGINKLHDQQFSTSKGAHALVFLPMLEELGIINAIKTAGFPGTSKISTLSSVLSILALKLVGCARLSHDETWNLDLGLGLFAGLNVLPKTASLSSYSYRATREANKKFIVNLASIFTESDCESGEFNLDFHAIPHWGDLSVLENHWNGNRGKAMKSILSLIVQDPNSGFISYTDAEVRRENQDNAILDFVDFWKESRGESPKMLVFDSKLTVYENLEKLNKDQIKFITLRRRGKRLLEYASSIPEDQWKKIKVERKGKTARCISVYEDHQCKLRGYEEEIRQVIIKDNGHEHPTFLITNDFDSSLPDIVRKYARRWLVEQEIAEQIAFFHLNQVGSSIVIKVDFDLTMTLLAHNLYRVLASKLSGFEHCTVRTIHRDFLENEATVEIRDRVIEVALKKKSHLPILFETSWMKNVTKLSWMGCEIKFKGGTSS